ncbi:UNVERIFIED_CONTAM: hypothetical protein Sindi_2418200 [Sesamum indicum]
MEAEIKRMGWTVRLTEEEGNGLLVPDELWNAKSDGHQLILVGRLLAYRMVTFKGFSRSVKSMINPVKGLEIKQFPATRFLLRFNHIIDRNRALAKCLWSFEENILILNGIGGGRESHASGS